VAELPPGGPGGGPPGSGGGLSKKLWGLPTWGWIAIAAAGGVVAFMWLQSRKAPAAASTTDPNSDGSASSGAQSDEIQSLLAQIRDMQGAPSTPIPTTGDTTTPATGGTTTAVKPAAITGLRAYNVTRGLIYLDWNDAAGSRGYDVQWTDGKNHTGNATTLTSSYTMINLPANMRYTIKVRGKHDLGGNADGDWSSPITVTTKK
jgi:hypothetical protein